MKKLLPLIILLVLSGTSFGQFWKPKPKPTPSPTPVAVQKSTNPVRDAKDVVLQLKKELEETKSENVKLEKSLTQARLDLDQSFKEVDILNKQIKDLKEWAIVQQAEAQKWLEKYTNAVKRYHRLKLIAAILAGAAGVLLGLQFMNFAPPPYNLLVPVGSAGLFATLVWIFL